MRWEDTCVRGHAGRTVAALFVRSRLRKVNDCLFWEVGHIVHRLYLPLVLGGLKNDGILEHDIAIVSNQFAANWAIE